MSSNIGLQKNVIVLSIGDELALGQTVDTNSAWISRHLAGIGLPTRAHMTVADDAGYIEDAIRACAAGCDFLLISGGLGPTADDLTREGLAKALGVPLETDAAAMAHLEAYFRRLKRTMVEMNKVQALIPRGARMIENTCGTAPGIDAAWQSGDQKRICRIFVMPGVPKEMKEMFGKYVLPILEAAGGGGAIRSRTLHTFGLGESNIAQMLGTLMQRGDNPSVGTTVANGIVSLRVNGSFGSKEQAEREVEEKAKSCRAVLGDLVFGEDDQTLQEVVAGMLMSDLVPPEVRKGGAMVATAESCTGGLLAKLLTDVPGSSGYFREGFVTYTNESKTEMLGVEARLIAEQGAVSEGVAEAMAAGAGARSGAAYALAITGIAGPDGGTVEKPVGTVCIALAAPERNSGRAKVQARSFRFGGDREFIRDRSAKMALTMLRFHLLGKEMPF